MSEATFVEVGLLPNCQHSAEIDKITPALVGALAQIDPAAKESENPHLRNRYADLASVVAVAKPPLAAAGIAIMQPPSVDGRTVRVATVLLHTSGQWYASDPLAITAIDDRAQSIGSAITYARRYSLSGLLGIVAEDDDGNAASGTSGKPAARPEPQRNTKAQQAALAQRRIAEERAKVQPPAINDGDELQPQSNGNDKPWRTVREMKDRFAAALSALGPHEAVYRRELEKHGVDSPDKFTSSERALACYRDVMARVAEYEALKGAANESQA